MKTPAAVLFDCDGVLADSEALVNAIVADQLTTLGWPMTPSESRTRRIVVGVPAGIARSVTVGGGVGIVTPWATEVWVFRYSALFRAGPRVMLERPPASSTQSLLTSSSASAQP